MLNLDAGLKEVYMNRPESVASMPEWFLPSGKIEKYRRMSHLAIVEIAGRDSVAAAVKAAEDEGFTDLQTINQIKRR